ncbi:MAG: hypothetical protein ACE5FS_13480, partial [Paracoccaceae bacterium]
MRRAPLAALVLAAASALAGGAASAQQQVQVLSGEHDGFSRLVFRLRPDLPHEVSTRPGLVRIKFPGRHLVFDVSGLFDKLSRERLVSVRQTGAAGGSVLQLNLACACEPFVFPFRGNYLVVDIRDPGAGAVTAAQPQPEPAAVAPRRGERGIYATADTRPLLDGLDAAAAGPGGEAPPELPASDPAAAEPGDETWRNLRHAHDALLQQLSRAAEQGLIALADPDTAPAARTAGEQSGRAMPGPDDERAGRSAHRAGPSPPPAVRDARIFADLPAPGAKSDGAPEPPGNDRGQVAVTTVFDRDDPPAGEQPHPALRCP